MQSAAIDHTEPPESYEGVPLATLAARWAAVEPPALRRVAARAARTVGLLSGLTPALGSLRRHSAIVLMYHKVQRAPRGPWGEPALDVAAFEEHCAFLARRSHVIPLSDLVAHLREGVELPPRAVVLTFDDGYRHNLVLAAPILLRYRLPATLFVATGLCGTDQWMWCFEVEALVRRRGLDELARSVDDRVVARIARASMAPRTKALLLVEYLKRQSAPRRDAVLDALRGCGALPPDDENRFLSWEEVRALAAAGIDIGSHSVTHPILTTLDEAAVEREVAGAKARIEQETGRPVPHFCYPNGDVSPAVRAVVGRHHDAAVTVEKGENRRGVDPYSIRRIGAPIRVADLAYQLVLPTRG